MFKKELFIIGIGLGIFIPMAIFVFFWYLGAILKIYNIVYFPESIIPVFALTGLCIGILMDILFLKRLIPQFYHIRTSILIIVYLYCSALAVAFFMGLPIGNFVLGVLAGFYMGRKYHILDQQMVNFTLAVKNTSLFAALITSLEALVIGLMIIQEDNVIASANQFIGFKLFLSHMLVDSGIVAFLGVVLFILQFFSTKVAARVAFNLK